MRRDWIKAEGENFGGEGKSLLLHALMNVSIPRHLSWIFYHLSDVSDVDFFTSFSPTKFSPIQYFFRIRFNSVLSPAVLSLSFVVVVVLKMPSSVNLFMSHNGFLSCRESWLREERNREEIVLWLESKEREKCL